MDKIINFIAEKTAKTLVKNNKIGTEKEEIYKYGALISFQSALNILTTLFLGFIFGEFFENICFFVAFKILRKYSGGLHSSRFFTCYLISTVSNIVILVSIKFLEIYPNYYLAIVLEIISFFFVFCFSPIVDVNKPISEKEHRIYKLIACVASLILICISSAFSVNECCFAFPISLAMLLNSILIIIGILKTRCFDKRDSI